MRIEPASTGPLYEALRRREVDLAFVHSPSRDPRFRHRRLHSESAVVAVTRGIGFDTRTEVRLEELVDLPYASIRHDADSVLYGRTDALLTRAGIHARLTVDSHNLADVARSLRPGRHLHSWRCRPANRTRRLRGSRWFCCSSSTRTCASTPTLCGKRPAWCPATWSMVWWLRCRHRKIPAIEVDLVIHLSNGSDDSVPNGGQGE